MATATESLTNVITRILADTYALAAKTHGAHWNVTGAGFFQLHQAFSDQYEALYEAADLLAERIRAMGAPAPGSLAELQKLSTLPAPPASHDGLTLAKALRDDHKRLAAAITDGIAAADEAGDVATADLLTGRLEEHDKTAWMLGAVVA
jgi:starvation-inducible DNA-binding protein